MITIKRILNRTYIMKDDRDYVSGNDIVIVKLFGFIPVFKTHNIYTNTPIEDDTKKSKSTGFNKKD